VLSPFFPPLFRFLTLLLVYHSNPRQPLALLIFFPAVEARSNIISPSLPSLVLPSFHEALPGTRDLVAPSRYRLGQVAVFSLLKSHSRFLLCSTRASRGPGSFHSGVSLLVRTIHILFLHSQTHPPIFILPELSSIVDFYRGARHPASFFFTFGQIGASLRPSRSGSASSHLGCVLALSLFPPSGLFFSLFRRLLCWLLAGFPVPSLSLRFLGGYEENVPSFTFLLGSCTEIPFFSFSLRTAGTKLVISTPQKPDTKQIVPSPFFPPRAPAFFF